MSTWNTYGVSLTDDAVQAEIADALAALGLKTWYHDGHVKATDFPVDETVSCPAVKRALQSYCDAGVSGLVHVSATDTTDTASGTVFHATADGWDRGKSRQSGGPNSRRNWPGLCVDGVRIAGGKY